MIKRAFDCSIALTGLVCLWPLFLLIAAAIKLDSPGPVLFRQERVGRGFTAFRIFKFRTMVADAPRRGGALTTGHDPRITRVGRALRNTKLDELPQLLNVLKGEMSLVGPRPEVPRYVALFRNEYDEILSVRPGITDLASLEFRDEATLLKGADNPEAIYVAQVLPAKLTLSKEYIRRSSIGFDLLLIAKTIAAVSGLRAPR
jgi:lipopolysaccharide/colanic/teichoic acid biosynthesis glycosyltransferase